MRQIDVRAAAGAVKGSPHIELDALHWLENWRERPEAKFAAAVRNAAQGDR